jgi:hypothetical protein
MLTIRGQHAGYAGLELKSVGTLHGDHDDYRLDT